MNKTIGLVFGAVVVIGGGYFAFRALDTKEERATTVVVEDGSTNASMGKKMAFNEFVKQGGTYMCTVKQHIESNGTSIDSDGTMYIDGGEMRGEFNTTVQGMHVSSNLLVHDGYTYTWSSMAPTMGFKIANMTASTNSQVAGDTGFNLNQIGDYDCKSWSVDESKFEVPTSIKFTEMKTR